MSDVEDWTAQLRPGARPVAHSTIRMYQQTLALFCDYAADGRHGWAAVCEQRFGTHQVQICHEWNTVAHVTDYEGRPGNRPLARDELQTLFDFADEQTARARRLGRKGWLAAFRDATLFKTIYAWGLRRQEAARLEVVDFGPNAAVPELGSFGMLSVHYGKAARGSSARRRNVCTVMAWRHSYVTHLIEDGFDPLFVQQQVGHARASTTALYTGVSNDYKNRVMRAALDRAFGPAAR